MKLAENELYAELERLKRERDGLQSAFEDAVTRAEKAEGERDALADALRALYHEVCEAGLDTAKDFGWPNVTEQARAALAQVRK